MLALQSKQYAMNTLTKTYIAAAIAAIFVITLIIYALANAKITKLEAEVAQATETAREKQQTALAKEQEAEQYKQKIVHLETKLTEINKLARKQDEELENLNNISRDARSNLDVARRTRTITATAAELCQKLADVGHPCE